MFYYCLIISSYSSAEYPGDPAAGDRHASGVLPRAVLERQHRRDEQVVI